MNVEANNSRLLNISHGPGHFFYTIFKFMKTLKIFPGVLEIRYLITGLMLQTLPEVTLIKKAEVAPDPQYLL